MIFEKIIQYVGSIPHMPPERGKIIYEFVRATKPRRVLELGFAHGTSSCYIAAALEENNFGSMLTIDHVRAQNREPNIHQLLEKTNLSPFVEARFCERTYNWELMKLIDQQTKDGLITPIFDFVFIDGGHTWDSDGFAFLLIDRLLRQDGWVLFDDVLWTPLESEGEKWVAEMPKEERNIAHIEKVFSLLVTTHPDYHNFKFDGAWAWAQKKSFSPHTNQPHYLDNIYRKTRRARRLYKLRRYIGKIFH